MFTLTAGGVDSKYMIMSETSFGCKNLASLARDAAVETSFGAASFDSGNSNLTIAGIKF